MAEAKSHHTGRGGGKLSVCCCFARVIDFDLEGNVHHIDEKEHPSNPEGLADKLKHKIGDDKDK